MAEERPGLQELIDLFDEASRQKEKGDDLKKLHESGARWYGDLFTRRVRSIDRVLDKQEKVLQSRRPRDVPATEYQRYVEERLTQHGQILQEEFPSGVYIKGSKADEARLNEVRRRAPVLVPLVSGEVTGVPQISTGRICHLRDDYVLRRFSELNAKVPKGVAQGLQGEDRKAAYRYALAWLIQKKESSVVRDMELLAETASLSGQVAVSNVGEKWLSYFDDLAAVAHWAINSPSSFLFSQKENAKRRATVRDVLDPDKHPEHPEEARVHFGRYLGEPFRDVPLTYLLWLQDLVPAAQTFMKALAGAQPDQVRIPDEARNPYFAGKRGDSLEQAVGRRVQDLDERTRARVVRFMETAANDVFARRLRTFTETSMFREAESKYLGHLSERDDLGRSYDRRLREGSVKDWYGQGVQESDVPKKEFAFREPAPGLSVRSAKMSKLPSMEEAERRRTLGLRGFRTPLPVQDEMLKLRSEEADVNVTEIGKAAETGNAEVAVWDMMLRWEEKIETTSRPEDLDRLLHDIKETVRRLPGLMDHEYYDVILSAWSEKMNAVRGRGNLAAGRRDVRRQGLSREELRGLASYQPPGASSET